MICSIFVSSPKGELSAVGLVGVQIMKVDFASENSCKVEMSRTTNMQRQTVKEIFLIMVKNCFEIMYYKKKTNKRLCGAVVLD